VSRAAIVGLLVSVTLLAALLLSVDLGALALDERPLSRERPAGWTAVEGARTTPLGAWAIHRLITDRP